MHAKRNVYKALTKIKQRHLQYSITSRNEHQRAIHYVLAHNNRCSYK